MKRHSEKYYYLYLIGIIAATIIIYTPSISNSFVWDDNSLIRDNAALRAPSPLFLFKQPFWTPSMSQDNPYYRPISLLWFWIGYKIWKISPFWYRIENLAVYILFIVLLYLFLRNKVNDFAALTGTAIFAFHPVHIENVAFVSGITDLSAGLFLIAGFLAHFSDKKFLRYALSPIFYLLAMLSKEIAVVGIAAIIIHDWIFKKNRLKKFLIDWALWSAMVPVYLFMRNSALGYILKSSGKQAPIFLKLLFAPYLLIRYIQNSILPLDIKPYHPEKLAQMSTIVGIISSVAIIFLVFISIKILKKEKIIIFGLLWFLLFLFPVLGIVDISSALWAERFLFIPSVGFVIVAGLLFEKFSSIKDRRIGKLPAILLSGYLLFLALISFTYSIYWRNDWILSRQMVDTAPDIPIGYAGLAYQFISIGEVDSAFYYSKKALELDSTYFTALNIFAGTYLERGEIDSAIFYLKKVISHYPDYVYGYSNMGKCLVEKGDTVLGVKYFEKAVSIAPRDAQANLNCGLGLIMLGDTLNGIELLRRACIYYPEGIDAPVALADLYISMGDTIKARRVIEKYPQIKIFYSTADTVFRGGKN